MSHPIDELMKRMLDLNEEGFAKMVEEAEAEVGDMEDLPETVEVEYNDGTSINALFRSQIRDQEVMRNVFDKLTEGLDLDAGEEE